METKKHAVCEVKGCSGLQSGVFQLGGIKIKACINHLRKLTEDTEAMALGMRLCGALEAVQRDEAEDMKN